MVELDIMHVSYFGGFLSVGSRESFEQNILFRLCFAKKSLQARPGPHLKAATKPGQARPCYTGPAWPLMNIEEDGN